MSTKLAEYGDFLVGGEIGINDLVTTRDGYQTDGEVIKQNKDFDICHAKIVNTIMTPAHSDQNRRSPTENFP